MNNRGFMPLLTSRGRVAWTTEASPFLLCLPCTFTALYNATHVYFPHCVFFFCHAGNTQQWKYMGARKTELIAVVLDYKLAFNILNQKNLLSGKQLPYDLPITPGPTLYDCD